MALFYQRGQSSQIFYQANKFVFNGLIDCKQHTKQLRPLWKPSTITNFPGMHKYSFMNTLISDRPILCIQTQFLSLVWNGKFHFFPLFHLKQNCWFWLQLISPGKHFLSLFNLRPEAVPLSNQQTFHYHSERDSLGTGLNKKLWKWQTTASFISHFKVSHLANSKVSGYTVNELITHWHYEGGIYHNKRTMKELDLLKCSRESSSLCQDELQQSSLQTWCLQSCLKWLSSISLKDMKPLFYLIRDTWAVLNADCELFWCCIV